MSRYEQNSLETGRGLLKLLPLTGYDGAILLASLYSRVSPAIWQIAAIAF